MRNLIYANPDMGLYLTSKAKQEIYRLTPDVFNELNGKENIN